MATKQEVLDMVEYFSEYLTFDIEEANRIIKETDEYKFLGMSAECAAGDVLNTIGWE